MKKEKELKLKEIAEVSLSPLISATEEEGEIRILKPSAVISGQIDESKLQYGKNETKKDLEKFYLKEKDIVFQAKGNKFEAVYIDKDYNNLVSNQIYFNIKVNKNLVNSKYLCWYLNNRISNRYFELNSSGAVIKSLNKKVLEDIQIKLPDIDTQNDIANLLDSFSEEKCKTLEYLKNKELLIEEKLYKQLRGDK